MSEDLDARIAHFRQRQQQDRGSLSEDVVRAKSQVADHATALADALDRRIVAAEGRADEVAAKVAAMGSVMIRVGVEITALEERLRSSGGAWNDCGPGPSLRSVLLF